MKLLTQIPFSNDENIPPPTLVRGTQYFGFIKIVDIIVGEYEPRVVYKRYNVVGNGRAVYLKLPVRFMALISRFNGVFYGRDEPYFLCAHSASASDRHRNQAYSPGTEDTVIT